MMHPVFFECARFHFGVFIFDATRSEQFPGLIHGMVLQLLPSFDIVKIWEDLIKK